MYHTRIGQVRTVAAYQTAVYVPDAYLRHHTDGVDDQDKPARSKGSGMALKGLCATGLRTCSRGESDERPGTERNGCARKDPPEKPTSANLPDAVTLLLVLAIIERSDAPPTGTVRGRADEPWLRRRAPTAASEPAAANGHGNSDPY
jgi:hypothetical protein